MIDQYIKTINLLKNIEKIDISKNSILCAIEDNLRSDFLTIDEGSMTDIDSLDLNMIPIIGQLNRLGLKTSYSCGGHFLGLQFLKNIYRLAQKYEEKITELFEVIQAFPSNKVEDINCMYVVILEDVTIRQGVLIPMNSEWYEEREFGKVILRCHSAKTIEQRDEFINDLLIHLSRIENL